MISNRWIEQRTPHWRRLESLVERATRDGFRTLGRDELQELGLLYRQAAADLATVRDDRSSARLAESLNRLLARAHHTIYGADHSTRKTVWHFLSTGFPMAVRAHALYIALAIALFLIGGAAGVGLTAREPDFALKVLGPRMIESIARREMWTNSIVSIKPLASSSIMTNNMAVSFMAFATGITAGLGTIYVMFFNGLLLGVVGTACAQAGMSLKLWSFVVSHGVLELPAIFIAGGAGLRLAHGLLFPGWLPRRESLARAGAAAVTLVVGCIPMLVIAGLIEAFVSPTSLATPLKFAFGGGLFVLLMLYILRNGSSASRPDSH